MERIQFTQLVDEALARLPKVFKDKIENLAVIVEDYPDKETQGSFSGIILGLFRGVPRTAAVVQLGGAAVTDLSLPEEHRIHLPQR